eukprot:TRINITY_DN374_c0_g1_i2.p1 TRINITY_DN374_c0_g1~~TRINITY_DN374_c0_g1_i2.p1  ORF type:complete len:142 (+),score=22.65 TRINITY_DN374_c0_g1_i2:60-428(+)
MAFTTVLGRTALRARPLGQALLAGGAQRPNALPLTPMLALGAVRALHNSGFRLGGHDWNLGIPGSRIKNPDPQAYNDVYPGMGVGWWSLIAFAGCSFFWSQWYDLSRPVNVAIGIFGPNMPM